VVIKAEVVRLPGRTPRDNARFVITNLRQSPGFVYEQVYCARGDIEIGSRSSTTGSRWGGRVAVASGWEHVRVRPERHLDLAVPE